MRAPAIAGRTRPGDPPPGVGRRGELAAGLATAAVVIQLVLAPATLIIAVTLIAMGRASRWRPHWLLLPASAGLGWLVSSGAARTGFVALPRVAHWSSLSAGLVRQLPLALLLGSSEAALVLWLVWWRSWPAWRPGLLAALRRRASARALPAGHTVTPDGFAIGLATATGRLAAVTWAEAERGVLLTGQDGARLGELGLAAACAAMRLRKTVVILDLARIAAAAAGLATSLGVPVTELTAVGQLAGPELGRAVRCRSVVVVRSRRPQAELVRLLESLREHDLRADCLAWISGCEQLDPGCLDRLLELAPATGTALLLSSTSEALAAGLAARVQVVMAEGPITGNLALQLASQASELPHRPRGTGLAPSVAANLAAQRSGEFTMLARGVTARRGCVLPNCLLVPVSRDVKP